MFFKKSHILQDIQYDAIGMRGSSYSYSVSTQKSNPSEIKEKKELQTQEDNKSIESIFLMNNELIADLYHKSLSVYKSVFIYSLPLISLFLSYQFLLFIKDPIGNGDWNAFVSLFSTMVLLGAIPFNLYLLYRCIQVAKTNTISFTNTVFKKFGIKFFNFSVEDKKNTKIGLIALFNVLDNSNYKKAIPYSWKVNQDENNHDLSTNLEYAVRSLNTIVKAMYINANKKEIEAKALKKAIKEQEKNRKKQAQIAMLQTNEDEVQNRIKNVYFEK